VTPEGGRVAGIVRGMSAASEAGAPLRVVTAIRYVLPLREGGSLPGLLEADDLGTYVVKFTGAGQGRKALIAEIIAARIAAALDLRVPELVLIDLDPDLGRTEPDQEVQDLLRASAGRNLGVDYLPRALGFDPAADRLDPAEAAAVVWFDALIQNVDRSWRNPNLLCWHGRLWLIDHGASLYFAHTWDRRAGAGPRPYSQVEEHVLLAQAGDLRAADDALAPRVTDAVLGAATATVPDDWLAGEPGFDDPDAVRTAYAEVLADRLANRSAWVEPLEDVRARL
jgi:hypothetical protein